MDKKQVISLMCADKYYSSKDLRYNQKIGIMLSREELNEFLDGKDALAEEGSPLVKRLPLKTFNSRFCFFANTEYLLYLRGEYLQMFISDYELNQNTLFGRNMEDMLLSRLFSEVEGSLNIENVPTTQKRIAEIHRARDLTEQNDIIVKNMMNALEYIINEQPEFNKDNLRKLYNILSKDCLPCELALKDGSYYRDDKVYIDIYEGADHTVVDECMDSLFAFANDKNSFAEYRELLPYICHYYILYIHPYFDYNGRTARMVSFWLNYIYKIPYAPYFMSEAINENKGEYYSAIVNSRTMRNDLTYFLGYILETSVKFSFVYKNLEELKNRLSKTGDCLSSAEWVYVKKILVHNPNDYFNYKMFTKYIGSPMSRTGVFKILNKLFDYGILLKGKNRKGETIYRLDPDILTYKYQ